MINPTDYINAVISQSFKDECLRPVYRENTNMVHFESGQMAFVFKLYNEDTGKYYAAKLYSDPDRLDYDRIRAIERYIKNLNSDYFVDYSFEADFIYVDQGGLPEDHKVKPAILMEWVDGRTLGEVVKELCTRKDYEKLNLLAEKFRGLALFLLEKNFAHGDLKHDNIIVDEGFNLKLVDYDGMFIPEFLGQKSTELGTRAFQHPKRTVNDFDRNLDDFSILIIYTSLRVFINNPYIHEGVYNQNNLLFDYQDLNNPEESKVFAFVDNLLEYKSIIKQIKSSLNSNTINIEGLDKIISDVTDIKEPIYTNCMHLLPRIANILQFYDINMESENPEIHKLLKELYNVTYYEKQRHIINIFGKLNLYQINSILDGDFSMNYRNYLSDKKDYWLYLNKNGFFNWKNEKINDWDLDELSRILSIPLGRRLIEVFGNKWIAKSLSSNHNVPWTIELIERYEKNWDWESFSSNTGLPWSIELIEKFEKKWNWKLLSSNAGVPWSIQLIEKYIDKWVWGVVLNDTYRYNSDVIGLSSNKSLPLSVELIEKFEEKWSWELLSQNEAIGWSKELIEKFIDKWVWGDFNKYKYNNRRHVGGLSSNKSLPWNIDFIRNFEDNWSWYDLSRNTGIPWSIEMIDAFWNKWEWGLIEYSDHGIWMEIKGLSSNKALPWGIELLEEFKYSWEWKHVSQNESIVFTSELIDKFQRHWDWHYLSGNNSLSCDIKTIKKHENKWHWELLSNNISNIWSCRLIEMFIDKWTWGGFKWEDMGFRTEVIGLSSNTALPWSIELLLKFEKRWQWEHISENESIPWTTEIIEKLENRLQWGNKVWYDYGGYYSDFGVCRNSSIPWSFEFIIKYQNLIDFSLMDQDILRNIINPYLDGEFKKEVRWLILNKIIEPIENY